METLILKATPLIEEIEVRRTASTLEPFQSLCASHISSLRTLGTEAQRQLSLLREEQERVNVERQRAAEEMRARLASESEMNRISLEAGEAIRQEQEAIKHLPTTIERQQINVTRLREEVRTLSSSVEEQRRTIESEFED